MKGIKIIVFLCVIKYSYGYLKDLGEETKFSKLVSNLSLANLGIAGGEKARISESPHSILFLNLAGICAGVILSLKIALTATHCFDMSTNLLEMKVYANSRFVADPGADGHKVWEFKIHKDFNNPIQFANNIAIIMIHGTFKFKNSVQKAVIVDNLLWKRDNETDFLLSGWGATKTDAAISMGFNKVRLRYLSNVVCSFDTGAELSHDMFCLRGVKRKGGPCHGDAGGGVLWRNKLVGIISHSGDCGEVPSIQINVFYHFEWIKTQIDNLYDKYCDNMHPHSPFI